MCIFKLCAAISQDFGLLEIGPLYYKHTQLNVCEKEELPCFLYLIQIFVFTVFRTKQENYYKQQNKQNKQG